MQFYSQRIRDNILPLSVGSTLPEAFEEWSFTDETYDHEEPVAVCGLCDKEELRYHFRIQNQLTGHRLWVGSHCILKFGLSVFDGSRKLTPDEAKKKLDRLAAQMRLEACIAALERLAEKERNQILTSALAYYKVNKFLTPKYAAVVLWRLQANGVDHSPSFFKVALRRDQHKEDLRKMNPRSFKSLWPALTAAQKKIALAMGHTPPGGTSGAPR